MLRDWNAYFRFPRIPTGRKIFALRALLKRAESKGRTQLAAQIRAAIKTCLALLRVERQWKARKVWKVKHGPKARILDRQIDRSLAGFLDRLNSPLKMYDPEHPKARSARALKDHFFPGGLGELSQKSFVEQTVALDSVLEGLQERPELVEAVELLGLADEISLLEALQVQYRAELGAEPAPVFAEIEAARRTGEDAFFEVLVASLALFIGEGSASDRETFLSPIWEQVEAVNEARRARRGGPPRDVDPRTGAIIDDPASDAPEDDQALTDVA